MKELSMQAQPIAQRIEKQKNLKYCNTFALDATARFYLPITAIDDLQAIAANAVFSHWPRFILGGGSNIVLPGYLDALVLHMQNQGRAVVAEDAHSLYVRAAAGESWDAFVQWTLAQGWGGLENLSLIPGCVGAAPIQNIGAYGVELKDRLASVQVFDFRDGHCYRVEATQCALGYRDSLFKRHSQDLVIVDVTFALPKRWQAQTHYAALACALSERGIIHPSPQQVRESVVAIRRQKLPDPAVMGNVGSFFKNPIVSKAQHDALRMAFPSLVSFALNATHDKLSAAWMIDQCGWKGRNTGTVGVHHQHALVLINLGHATAEAVLALAHQISADVLARFGVILEIEPVVVDA